MPGNQVGFASTSALMEALNDDNARRTIAPMLTDGVTYERLVREVYMAASDNAKLLRCSAPSLIRAICKVASWGLVIGETAHLVPYGATCKAIQDYKGKIELMIRHRAARLVDAQCVYANEKFVYEAGTVPRIEHWPIMDPAERGELVGGYAFAKITMYEFKVVVMSAKEVDAIRQEYSQQHRSGDLADIPWYVKKTLVHQLGKQIPKSEALAKALAEDDGDSDPDAPASAVPSLPERKPAPVMTLDAGYAPEVAQAQAVEVPAREVPRAPLPPAVAAFASQPSPYDEPNTLRDEQPAPVVGVRRCPRCKGPMWDNTAENAKRRRSGMKQRPDFACKEKEKCGYVIWPDDDRRQPDAIAADGRGEYVDEEEEELPF